VALQNKSGVGQIRRKLSERCKKEMRKREEKGLYDSLQLYGNESTCCGIRIQNLEPFFPQLDIDSHWGEKASKIILRSQAPKEKFKSIFL
jgi:hypothetical protein